MANLQVDVGEVRKLIGLVEAYGLEELTVEQGDLAITVKGLPAKTPHPDYAHAPLHVSVPEPAAAAPEEPPTAADAVEEELTGEIADITAPLVGVFYRAPAPDAPAFVEVGDFIEVGTEVGLIEAMKVFSPIPSEVAGEVVAIPCANGKLVHEGEVLVRVRITRESETA